METETRDAVDLSVAVAKEIRIMLVRLDMKQTELAARLGVNEMWLSRRLRGAQEIGLNDLQRIAGALGVEALALMPRTRNDSAEGRLIATGGARGDRDREVTRWSTVSPVRPGPPGHPHHTHDRESTRRPTRIGGFVRDRQARSDG